MRPFALLVVLCAFCTPSIPADELDKLLEQAAVHRQAKNYLEAFNCYESVIRNSENFAPKRTAREQMLDMGPIPAREQTGPEKALVASRIKDEKVRHFRFVIDKLAGKKQYHGVLLLRQAIIDNLEDKTEIEREERTIKDLKFRMTHLELEKRKDYQKLVDATKPEQLPKLSASYRQKGDLVTAAELLRDFDFKSAGDDPKREKTKEDIAKLEAEILAAVPPAEKKQVDEAVNHRIWGDLTTVQSHHFIYIGDKSYVTRIPPKSMLELDLAYIFITDMLDNNPDQDGMRITIFFKELWEFGGGIGGGKTIDIGSVNIKAKEISVSNFLFFHELCHCLFDTGMIYKGFIEGVANFGATFAYDAMGYKVESDNNFKSNYDQFVRFYQGRDLSYFRIQNYGPSAGFWLYFAKKYAQDEDGRFDWARYRRFFRLWRKFPIQTDRTVEKIRYFARCLAEVFGPGVIEDLINFRFPIEPDELERVRAEVTDLYPAYQEGTEKLARRDFEGALESLQKAVAAGPGLEVAALAREQILHLCEQTGNKELQAKTRDELGIVMDWRLCGPFYSEGGQGLFDIYPPETEVDFDKKYDTPMETAKWWLAKPRYDGVVGYEFHYPANAAAYGLCYLQVNDDTDAYVHVGSDDGHAVWVNHRLVEKRDESHGVVMDHDRYPVKLWKGMNKLLIKIQNGSGGLAFLARVTNRKGLAIPGLQVFPTNREPDVPPAPTFKPKGKVFGDDFHSKATIAASWITGCGGWKIQNKEMTGTDTKHNALWRRFLVTPGVEKDSPANMAWLKPKYSTDLKDMGMELDLSLNNDGYPKFCAMLDGEGENDGLSGLTLVFLPYDEGMDVRFEWWDQIFYFRRVKLPKAKVWKLSLNRVDGFVSVTLNGQVFFDRVSLPVLRSQHVGFATFGAEPGITRFLLTAGGKN